MAPSLKKRDLTRISLLTADGASENEKYTRLSFTLAESPGSFTLNSPRQNSHTTSCSVENVKCYPSSGGAGGARFV